MFLFSSAGNGMEIEALLRHTFVLIGLSFCFNGTMGKTRVCSNHRLNLFS